MFSASQRILEISTRLGSQRLVHFGAGAQSLSIYGLTTVFFFVLQRYWDGGTTVVTLSCPPVGAISFGGVCEVADSVL